MQVKVKVKVSGGLARPMITLYTWPTPNGRKISIALEEMGLGYEVERVDLFQRQQFEPEFVALNPNAKIPVITDTDGPGGKPISVVESGAILLYLARKTGMFLPKDEAARSQTEQWLFFQTSSIGPMIGQLYHFKKNAPEQIDYAITRYDGEMHRLLSVMERRLAEAEFMAGEYSIVDMASYPWIAALKVLDTELDAYPSLSRWIDIIGAREPVKRGMAVPTRPN